MTEQISYRELSNRNATSSVGNSKWTTMIQPLTLNEGDTMTISGASINTLQTSNSDIVLPQDVDISAVFGIYDMDSGLGGDETPGENPGYNWIFEFCGPYPFDTYGGSTPNSLVPMIYMDVPAVLPDGPTNPAFWFTQHMKPRVFTKTFTIKAGTYTAPQMATTISQFMSTPTKNSRALLYSQWSPNYFPAPDASDQKLVTVVTQPDRDDEPPVNVNFGPANWFVGAGAIAASDDGTLWTLGQYRPETLTGWGHVPNSWKNEMLGASQASLIYDPPTGRYGWDSLHTPIFAGVGGPESNWLDFTDVDNAISVNQIAGLYLCDLQPASFWSQLGDFSDYYFSKALEWSNETLPFNNSKIPYYQPTFENFLDKVTQTELFISNIAMSADGYVYGAKQNGYSNKVLNRTLWAKNTVTSADNALWRIALDCTISSDFASGTNAGPNIFAQCNKAYTAGGYATLFPAGAFPYVHRGDPITISSIGVSIINSTTNMPDENIGGDNFIYITIARATTPAAVAEPAKETPPPQPHQ